MRKLSVFFALIGLVMVVGLAAAVDTAEVGVGVGVILPSGDTNPCPPAELMCNHDGSFENGYAWRYAGIQAPYYGAFAEGYSGTGTVCGMEFYFTTLSGLFTNQAMDVYVWDSDGLNPNNVLAVTTNVHISAPALWPNISTHDVDSNDAVVAGDYFVGYWGNWPGLVQGWYCAADLDGFGGLPRTNLAPGSGYGTGWADPSIVWGPTQSMGICAWFDGGPIPVQETTWGAIKALY